MNNEGLKFVEFNRYCRTCKNKGVAQDEEPCNECLATPTNQYSHKPVNYEKDDTKKETKKKGD